MAVSPARQGSRFLYFSPLTSLKLFRVKTAALNNEEDISHSVEELGRKSSQSDGLAMDNRGNLYVPVITVRLSVTQGSSRGQICIIVLHSFPF